MEEEAEDLAALQLEFEANIAKLEGILIEINSIMSDPLRALQLFLSAPNTATVLSSEVRFLRDITASCYDEKQLLLTSLNTTSTAATVTDVSTEGFVNSTEPSTVNVDPLPTDVALVDLRTEVEALSAAQALFSQAILALDKLMASAILAEEVTATLISGGVVDDREPIVNLDLPTDDLDTLTKALSSILSSGYGSSDDGVAVINTNSSESAATGVHQTSHFHLFADLLQRVERSQSRQDELIFSALDLVPLTMLDAAVYQREKKASHGVASEDEGEGESISAEAELDAVGGGSSDAGANADPLIPIEVNVIETAVVIESEHLSEVPGIVESHHVLLQPVDNVTEAATAAAFHIDTSVHIPDDLLASSDIDSSTDHTCPPLTTLAEPPQQDPVHTLTDPLQLQQSVDIVYILNKVYFNSTQVLETYRQQYSPDRQTVGAVKSSAYTRDTSAAGGRDTSSVKPPGIIIDTDDATISETREKLIVSYFLLSLDVTFFLLESFINAFLPVVTGATGNVLVKIQQTLLLDEESSAALVRLYKQRRRVLSKALKQEEALASGSGSNTTTTAAVASSPNIANKTATSSTATPRPSSPNPFDAVIKQLSQPFTSFTSSSSVESEESRLSIEQRRRVALVIWKVRQDDALKNKASSRPSSSTLKGIVQTIPKKRNLDKEKSTVS